MGNRSNKGDSHHLVINLKRKVRDQHLELQQKCNEVELLKRNIKNTRTHETETEIKMYMDECVRLRASLEEVIKSKDTFADPQELKIIEQKFQQRDGLIQQLQSERQGMEATIQQKDEDNRQLALLVQDMERRLKKAQSSAKANTKNKAALKDSEMTVHKFRKELMALRDTNRALEDKIQSLKEAQVSVRPAPPLPRAAQQAHPQQAQPNAQQTAELRRLQVQFDNTTETLKTTQNTLDKLRKEHNKKVEELAIALQDRTRFKELSESYMQEVARLEAQMEQADIKPKAKGVNRPKDTVKRDQSGQTNTNKQKRVESKQLHDVVAILKLKLQELELTTQQMQDLFFPNFKSQEEVNIAKLKSDFESLGIKAEKAYLLARYVVEPKSGGDIVVNEHASCSKGDALDALYDLIGPYKIYSESHRGVDYASDAEMLKKVVDKFGRKIQNLIEALSYEDFEDSGLLDLQQVWEAILSLDESIDDHVLDWMMYYVYSRSEHVDRMEYKVLIALVEDAIKSKGSSPGKNAGPAMVNQKGGSSDDEDNYSSDQNQDEIGGGVPVEDDFTGKSQSNYDESPRQHVPADRHQSNPGAGGSDEEYDEDPNQFQESVDVDEEEMINVAEKIFVRLADEIKNRGVTVRQILQPHIFLAEIDGDAYELIPPQGLIEALAELGLEDMQPIEVNYLLKVLSKPELDGAILMQEFLEIMKNFDLYDEEPTDRRPSESDQASHQQADESDSQPQASAQQKRKGLLDLSQLDQKSVKVMVMLMLFLLENEMTTAQFFESVVKPQKVQHAKGKTVTLDVLHAKDFFGLLQERGIRKKDTEHANLKEFLQLSPQYPDLLVLKNIRKTLEQMAENDEFMEAIREDLMMAQQDMEGGEAYEDDMYGGDPL